MYVTTTRRAGKITAVRIGPSSSTPIADTDIIPVAADDIIGIEIGSDGTQARVFVREPKERWSRWERIKARFGYRRPSRAVSDWIDLPPKRSSLFDGAVVRGSDA